MPARKSISQKLARARSVEVRNEIKTEWAVAWEKETMDLFKRLERGIRLGNYDEQCIATGQLKAVMQKHFAALPRVLVVDTGPQQDTATSVSAENPEPQHIEDTSVKPMPTGYITAREWAIKNGKSARRGQLILTDHLVNVPGAIKVRNPRGGVPVWAVPEGTEWPY